MAAPPVTLPDLSGRVIAITGGNSGIGKETAISLARAGATVAITARDPQRGHDARMEIERRSGTSVDVVALDLADFVSIRAAAAAILDRYDRLDVLVNNAGLVMRHRTETAQGFEMTFGVNHLGHFLLTQLLTERLVASAPARVVVVASDAHKFVGRGRGHTPGLDFDDLQCAEHYRNFGFAQYGVTKLANILFSNELARRLDATGVTSNAVHPGFTASNLARDGDAGWIGAVGTFLTRPFAKRSEDASAGVTFLAGADAARGHTGEYWERLVPTPPAPAALDEAAAERLWRVSEELIAGVN